MTRKVTFFISNVDTEWQIQYDMMNPSFFGLFNMPTESYGNINTVLVVMMSPLCSYYLYPFIMKRYKFRVLERMAAGFVFIWLSFLLSGVLNYFVVPNYEANSVVIDKDHVDCSKCLSGQWQFFQYFLSSFGEVLFSISGLEFSIPFYLTNSVYPGWKTVEICVLFILVTRSCARKFYCCCCRRRNHVYK